MSLAIVYTRAALGIEAPLITVEVHLSNGLPGLTMVGLPETTVKEARDRVRSALINSGYAFPAKKITINLAPADLPKEGGRYDLPIALALLVASEQLNTTRLNQYEFVGELALTGGLRGVPGAIPSAMEAIKAGRRIVVSSDNAAEVGLIGGSDCLVADHLQEVCAFLAGQTSLSPPLAEAPARDERYEDLLDVIGQQQGKRALGDCGRRWSQPAPDRPARDRENHASQPTPRSPAAIKQSGSAGERGHTESGQPPHRKDAVASEAVPRPPP